MSWMIIAILFAIFIFVIALTIAIASDSNSGFELLGFMGVFLSAVTFFGFVLAGSLNAKITNTIYIKPTTVTKTSDGYTIVPYLRLDRLGIEHQLLYSSRADIYMEKEENLLIMVKENFNHWGIKLADVKSDIVIKKNLENVPSE